MSRPLRNRVLPTGEIIAHPGRGRFTGNRGILHIADEVMGTRRWTHQAWICCTLDWQGRRLPVMRGRRWTALFFLDEAVALAAGHRPCAYCRRSAFNAFQTAWKTATGTPARAPDMDKVLHAARTGGPGRRPLTDLACVGDLPCGSFVQLDGQPHLWARAALWPMTPAGYQNPVAAPPCPLTVLTPAPMRDVLSAGYRPRIALPST